jgi:hypothetical protein
MMFNPKIELPARRGRTLKLYLVDGTPSGVIDERKMSYVVAHMDSLMQCTRSFFQL